MLASTVSDDTVDAIYRNDWLQSKEIPRQAYVRVTDGWAEMKSGLYVWICLPYLLTQYRGEFRIADQSVFFLSIVSAPFEFTSEYSVGRSSVCAAVTDSSTHLRPKWPNDASVTERILHSIEKWLPQPQYNMIVGLRRTLYSIRYYANAYTLRHAAFGNVWN
jgi:hypothetical protein